MYEPIEPFKIKSVEPIRRISAEERRQALERAGYNVFLVPADEIYIDLLTDSGTSAMSDYQWAGIMMGDESYAGSVSFRHFREQIQRITGYDEVIPTHQGRAAEHLLFSTILKKGDRVPSNTHFDTTRANVETCGCEALDLQIPEATDLSSRYPFKGNMDVAKLEQLLQQGTDNIPLVMLTVTNNSMGGHPVSMANIRAVSEVVHRYNLPLFLDACRFAENAFFIKRREPGFENKSIEQIAHEMFSYADGCTMSAKKDALVNIGGFLAMNNKDWADRLRQSLILIEGFPTYGGLAGRDLEAIARGLEDVLHEDYLEFRTGQVAFLGKLLTDAGVPVIQPFGGHAVYVDAKTFLAHIPPSQFPGQVFVCELYLEAGIRSVEIGSVMFAHQDKQTGEWHYPELELVRLAIPRRVYTNSHMRFISEAIISLYQRRQSLKGLKIVYDPGVLRHFTARFEPR
ncbi:tryptophanase [bacterium]|nr:tryptophanase [bacterium]